MKNILTYAYTDTDVDDSYRYPSFPRIYAISPHFSRSLLINRPDSHTFLLTMQLFTFLLMATAFVAADSSFSPDRELQDSGNPFVECGEGFCNTVRASCLNNTDNEEECVCDDGYTGDNCEDNIDECALDVFPCNGTKAAFFCVNEEPPKKFKCGCQEGYFPEFPDSVEDDVPLDWRPAQCIDINECGLDTYHNCTEGTECVNTPGSFECVAPTPAPPSSACTIANVMGTFFATVLFASAF